MKVLHVAPSLARSYGGPTQSLAGYAAAARLAGAEVTIAAPECALEDTEAMARQSGVSEIELFPSFSRGAFIVSPQLIRWVRQKSKRFDVVHVHGLFNPTSSFCIRGAREAGRAVVICPHGTLSRYTFRHRRTALKRAYMSVIERSNLERAAAIHFTTATERDEASWHGIDIAGRAHVVPPPFLPDPTMRPHASLRGDAPVILFMSRIHPVKNVDGLLRAWRQVLASERGAKLVIAGPGKAELVNSLKALAKTLDVAHSVTFCGFVDGEEKARLLAEATVFALPSYHENFGLVVLEAAAAGIPSVISPDVQLAPFIDEHRLGIISDIDPPKFAAALLTAIRDTSLQARVARSGCELVSRHYATGVIGEKLMSMYLSAHSKKNLQ